VQYDGGPGSAAYVLPQVGDLGLLGIRYAKAERLSPGL
jgi:hypothetical protein